MYGSSAVWMLVYYVRNIVENKIDKISTLMELIF